MARVATQTSVMMKQLSELSSVIAEQSVGKARRGSVGSNLTIINEEHTPVLKQKLERHSSLNAKERRN